MYSVAAAAALRAPLRPWQLASIKAEMKREWAAAERSKKAKHRRLAAGPTPPAQSTRAARALQRAQQRALKLAQHNQKPGKKKKAATTMAALLLNKKRLNAQMLLPPPSKAARAEFDIAGAKAKAAKTGIPVR